jgi:hypothetical protein
MKIEEHMIRLRNELLALEGIDLVEAHGWLLGVAIAIERKRGAPYWEGDALVAELRASTPESAAKILGRMPS